jgi:hypothetical protein
VAAPGRATAIVARMSWTTGSTTTVHTLAKLTSYGVAAAIPTSFPVPCYGSGLVTFRPTPTSTAAKRYVVKVTFEDLAVAPLR